MQDYSARFKDAPWMEGSKNEKIYIVGVGGIGSNTLYNLVKTIPSATYMIQDMDKVDDVNVGTQFFRKEDVGKFKVNALKYNLEDYSDCRIIQSNSKYDNEYCPIMISALDNMETRKQMFEIWRGNPNRELFVDGRLRANYYEVFAVTPGLEDKYAQTLFNDEMVDSGPCTFKATAYFGMLCGARITQVVVNYLSNKYSEPIYSLPFKVNEFGDLFHYEANN